MQCFHSLIPEAHATKRQGYSCKVRNTTGDPTYAVQRRDKNITGLYPARWRTGKKMGQASRCCGCCSRGWPRTTARRGCWTACSSTCLRASAGGDGVVRETGFLRLVVVAGGGRSRGQSRGPRRRCRCPSRRNRPTRQTGRRLRPHRRHHRCGRARLTRPRRCRPGTARTAGSTTSAVPASARRRPCRWGRSAVGW